MRPSTGVKVDPAKLVTKQHWERGKYSSAKSHIDDVTKQTFLKADLIIVNPLETWV